MLAASASSSKPGIALSRRNVSLMHLAMHDSLNAISGRYDPYRVHRSAPGANAQAAVVAAGHGVAVRLYPDQASSLGTVYSSMLATIPDAPSKNEGVVLGDAVAAAIVAFRADPARECVEGRMLSGAHFRVSNEDARYLGQHIGRYVLRTILAVP
jgi:hypothetical protein